VARARITSGLVRKLRARLALTQAQLASLLGVSAAAVQSWEQNIARPAGANKASLIALRKMGKREVARLLAAKGVAERRRRPRTQLQPSRKTRGDGGEDRR
jgi:transcriptional regulator with XRE-family HTH domain